MGVAKQLLAWRGTSLIKNAINQAKSSIANRVFVVLGANYTNIRKEIASSPVSIIRNEAWEIGLGSSIASGIEHIKQHQEINAALIMLVDQPSIDSKYLNVLIQTYIKNKKGIVATQYGNKYGVPAIFSNFYFDKLAKLNSDKGARELIGSHLTDVIGVVAEKDILDIDTMQDYKRLSKLYLKSGDRTK